MRNSLVHAGRERARLGVLPRSPDAPDYAAIADTTPEAAPTTENFRISSTWMLIAGRVNFNPSLRVPIDSSLSAPLKVESATATIQDSSNLKQVRADVVRTEPDAAVGQYSTTGPDHPVFGNCPTGRSWNLGCEIPTWA